MRVSCFSRKAHASCLALGLVFLLTAASADELYPNELDGNDDQSHNFECIGSWGEQIHNFVARGHYVYLGQGNTVRVLDIADAARPVEVGWLRVAGKISTMDLKGPALYVATDHEGHGLKVIDISNPAKPRLGTTLPGNNLHLMAHLMGDYLMVNEAGKWGEGYQVYQVRNSLRPEEITRGGRRGFEVNPFCTDGKQFFEATQSERRNKSVAVRELTALPTMLGRLPFDYDKSIGFSYDLKRLTAGNEETTLTLPLRKAAKTLWFNDPSFVMETYNGPWVLREEEGHYDAVCHLSSRSHPGKILLTLKSENWDSRSVVFADSALYAVEDGKVHIYELDLLTGPVRRGAFPAVSTFHNPIQIVGSRALVNSDKGLCIFDISRRFEPRLLGCYRTFNGVQQVMVSGKRAFVIDGEGGICVLDVSHPEHLKMLARHVLPGGTPKLEAVDGACVYLRRGESTLQIHDFSDPTSPSLLGSCEIAAVMSVSGGRLYNANGGKGFVVMDVSHPAAIRELGQLDLRVPCLDMTTSGSLVYLVNRESLYVVDAADPAKPVLRGKLDGPFAEEDWTELHLRRLDSALYILQVMLSDNTETNVQIVDVSNPAEPEFPEHGFSVKYEEADKAKPTMTTKGAAGKYPGWILALPTSFHTTGPSGSGVVVFDVSDPFQPVEAGCYDRMQTHERVTLGKDLLFLADEWGGLMILRPIQK